MFHIQNKPVATLNWTLPALGLEPSTEQILKGGTLGTKNWGRIKNSYLEKVLPLSVIFFF